MTPWSSRYRWIVFVSVASITGFALVWRHSDRNSSESVQLLANDLFFKISEIIPERLPEQVFEEPVISCPPEPHEPKQSNRTLHDITFYNLMGDAPVTIVSDQECTLDFINNKRLQQDHPCVVETIRRKYLYPPALQHEAYKLNDPLREDPSDGQSKTTLNYLKNQTGGFFIECGALDGEYRSNTIYMERFLNWTGILIEADYLYLPDLLSKRRKSYALPVCLSTEPYPMTVTFNRVYYTYGHIQNGTAPNTTAPEMLITVQCFPLYSVLLAVGRTTIDFFSLDVQGAEIPILKYIPFHLLNIRTMTVEWDMIGKQPLIDLLGPKGYYVFGTNVFAGGDDLLFAKNETAASSGRR